MVCSSQQLRLGCTATGLRQAVAPPRGFRGDDPLTRWSRRLVSGWPKRCLHSHLCVGLEGCTSAFNALNSIRTCMHFGTTLPPFFLSLSRVEDIHFLRPRCAAQNVEAADGAEPGVALRQVARFGEGAFLNSPSLGQLPLVALENYTNRSESILSCRFPPAARLVVGHENNGVSRKYIDELDGAGGKNCRAEVVVYVPQYGTISSLNVVTSMGIALFYATLDAHYPSARTLVSDAEGGKSTGTSSELEALRAYQRFFRQRLPSTAAECSILRVDQRPIHPFYYKKNVSTILEMHRQFRQLLLQVCLQRGFTASPGRFGLSVLYENERDQRSLGGILRSANAFLVDQVLYFGRKKVNVVGTVGTQHYTPPVYLGSSISDDSGDAEGWATKLFQRVEAANGAAGAWWFFDCGHAFLYSETAHDKVALEERERMKMRATAEALRWYNAHRGDPEFNISLCDSEERLREVAQGGVVLLVPQEGVLPPFHLLRRCQRILTLLPNGDQLEGTAGLPVAVAGGIALQRLSAVMHPRVLIF
ncbi:methyltransferase [Trypanosoma conorhini]|uniref:Methyltransferase n=1 Tax=Trypanosoma conorhini TaxID=83891 RepID=A0A422PTX9_9TRYP|nr:methyltransferase [Trypanosoma conorhini]RNF21173.1 methyltransferase [Trypanosoma conorhini]